MSIKTVTTDDLRRMNGKEGLVLQGCGGDPQECSTASTVCSPMRVF